MNCSYKLPIRTDPSKATLFYMVFACGSLTMMQQYKFGVIRHTQDAEGEELAFTDFFANSGASPPPLVRKTDDRMEADVIFRIFKGKEGVRLGKQFHS